MKKGGTIAGIIVAVIVIVGIATCLMSPSPEPSGPSHTSLPTVIYKISGTAERVDVTLSNAGGGTEQYSNVYVPKQYSYYSFSDDFVYISAQNQGEYGTVTVSIYVDDVLFKTSTSSGAYVIATASGLIK
jgi:hypothetical protein